MLQIKDLSAGYGRKEVLHRVSLACPKGTVTALIGPNGCGKSTLLKAVLGMVPFRVGTVTVGGQDTQTLSRRELAQRVAYLSQGKAVPDIPAGRMVLHGRFPYLSYPRTYRKIDRDLARQAMERLEIAHLADTNMQELSGGLRQKVYIAMALCQEAELILLDEPSTYLDIAQQLRLADGLRRLAGEGKTVLTVSHDITAALGYADQMAVLRDGTLQAVGTPQAILEAGVLESVFGVGVQPVATPEGTAYVYRAKEGKA